MGNQNVNDVYANEDGTGNLHAGALYLNGTEIEATADELNKLAGVQSLLTGYGNSYTEKYSLGYGINSNADGKSSIALGPNSKASDYGQVVIGQYNETGSTPTSDFAFSKEVAAFVIGNGVSSSDRSDAFVVGFNGDTKIEGELNVSGPLNVNNTVYINGLQTGGALIENDLEIKGSLYLADNKITVEANDINTLSGIDGNVQEQLNTKQSNLTAGDGVSISEEGVISSNSEQHRFRVRVMLILMKWNFIILGSYSRNK